MSATCWCAIMGISVARVAVAGPPERLFPPCSPVAASVDVVDFRDAPPSRRLAATTLQGLVNGGAEARVYLLLLPTDAFWLDRMVEKGQIRQVRRLAPEAFFAEYAPLVQRVYAYDGALPATINVATMLAALENGVVADPGDAGALMPGKPIEHLSGRWADAASTYEWAFIELWPRLRHDVLACYHPSAKMTGLRDYLVRQRVFTFWVSAPGDEGAPNPGHARERALAERVLAAAPPNTAILGFWYSGIDSGIGEYDGVGLAGEYGKITVVSDWSTNLSFLGGVSVDFAPIAKAQQARQDIQEPAFDPEKVYIGFNVVESGDAPCYLQTRQTAVWADPDRGRIPIGWGMGLGALELMPPVAAHFLETATPNDHWFAAISGAGYVHPYRRFMSRVADPGAGWSAYLRLTETLMGRAGFAELGLYTDAWKPYERGVMDPVTLRFAEGVPSAALLLLGMGRDEGVTAANGVYTIGERGVTAAHILTRWPTDYAALDRETRVARLLGEIREQTPPARPAFMQVMALSWAYGPGEIAEVAEALGPEYEAVSLPQFRRLWRAAASVGR
ncbi:MAG TPA: GxGYxYP family putative glycoside hydrolase [Candidatus Hydrogenedentes bacterium]|nr:GxGYxYP family putative glycoside hydrolase [Candidatus Hydrogenedentota bacterium]